MHAAKPITARQNTPAIEVRAGQPTEGTYSACPSYWPSTVLNTIGLVFDIELLKCSEASILLAARERRMLAMEMRTSLVSGIVNSDNINQF